jgi:putative transposase
MKLSRKKIRGIIRQKKKEESTGIIAKIQRITRRRVDQLWKQYQETGIIPVIGRVMGRPKKPVTDKESGMIERSL